MNCAWHGEKNDDENGSHGICDDCMQKYFAVDAQSIYDEIEAERVSLVIVIDICDGGEMII